MHFTQITALTLGFVGVLEAAATPRHHHAIKRQQNRNGNGGGNGGGNNGGNGNTCLNENLIQSNSNLSGQEPGSEGIADGQAESATDAANFINFCQGSTITNGAQVREGSCNGVVMGKIPSVNNMITAMIVEPATGQQVESDQTFTIRVQTQGLDAGSFVNPTLNYYSAPQDVNGNGDIIGHCHVTIQELGDSVNPQNAPDPETFAFFKGINDAGNGQGLLEATVEGGLVPGFYRVCTMIAASNHQPVMMPVAQRGAQDDCTKFEVVAAGGGNGGNNGGNDGGNDNNGGGDNGGNNSGNGGGNNNGGAVQVVSGTLGGAPPAIEDSGDSQRPFRVNGNTFNNQESAVERACDIQRNACLDGVNRGQISGSSINDCEQQRSGCRAA